jgi:lipid-A-disaccharide synthase
MAANRIFISTGDHSGDMYAARLIQEIRSIEPDCEFLGLGGSRMELQGFRSLVSIADISLVGFAEVLPKLTVFIRLLNRIKRLFRENPPRLVILVDYPGLNLRIARIAKEVGIPVLYYIAPQVWAWGLRRVGKMKRYVDRVAVIIPFEVEFYHRHGILADYVGHPILEALEVGSDRAAFLSSLGIGEQRPVLAMLPGVRRNEIDNLLPKFLSIGESVKQRHPGVEVVMSSPDPKVSARIREPIRCYEGASHDLIAHADCLLTKSGTAVLEAAVLGTPMIVCYRLSVLNYLLARMFIRTEYISLVNLLMERKVVPEFIQAQVTRENVVPIIEDLLDSGSGAREAMVQSLREVKARLGSHDTSREVARIAGLMMDGCEAG